MNLKITLAVAASVIGITACVPYIRDIFRRKTTPHSYSWLVWTILQITGALAMLASGAGWGVFYLVVGAGFCAFIFVLSLWYGTKNITTFDTVCLVAALGATSVWFFLHDALASIVLVACIDFVAFLPTFRKAYAEPWSENVANYFFGGVAQVLSLASLSSYTITTSLYLITLATANAAFTATVLIRRSRVAAPNSSLSK